MKKLIFVVLLASIVSLSGTISKQEVAADRIIYEVEYSGSIKDTGEFIELEGDVDEWTLVEDSGAPALPYREFRIAVPPSGELDISVSVLESHQENLFKPLLPAPEVIALEKSSEFIYAIDPSKYADSEKPEVVQGNRYEHNGFSLIPVRVYPISYNWESQTLDIRERMRIEIKIEGNTRFRGIMDNSRADLDSRLISNYSSARYWRIEPERFTSGIDFSKSQFWYKVSLSGSGNYCFDADDLAILPDFADYNDLRLFSLEPDESGKRLRYLPEETGLYIEGDQVYFSHAGEGKVLWLSLSGNFREEPLRIEEIPQRCESIDHLEYQEIELERGRDIGCVMIRPQGYFESQAEELLELHLNHFDIESQIVIQEDIFAQYAGGLADPLAIVNYLEGLYNDNPSLEYVVLLGSGTSDFDYPTEKNKIITIERSYFAADDYFVEFDGGSDKYPELSIGRIPVQTENMMDTYVDKLRRYLEEQENGWWQNRMAFIADDENKKGGLEGLTISSGMNHTRRVEDTAEDLPERLITKLYGIEYEFDAYKSKPGVTEDMIESINEGVVVTYYIGHGSWDNLGDEEYFSVNDIQYLTNYDHLTQFIAGSCNVGHFDLVANECMAELFLLSATGGSISSIAASEASSPLSNVQLLGYYLNLVCSEEISTGKAFLYSKHDSPASILNSNKYNLLGDPLIKLPIPVLAGEITGLPRELLRRDSVGYAGNFEILDLNSNGKTQVFDSSRTIYYSYYIPPDTTLVYEVEYASEPGTMFRAEAEIAAGGYQAGFIVPDDAASGNYGKILTLANEEEHTWLNTVTGVVYADSTKSGVSNDNEPEVSLYLNSREFQSGETVSSNPVLIADLYDENGINVSGSAGRSILVLLDESNNAEDLIDVTSGFVYEQGSCTRGSLSWQLKGLANGNHELKLIAYDNFGKPAVGTLEFKVSASGNIIKKLLPYPNPMEDDGYFTFELQESAEVTISLYTISGKKIRVIKGHGMEGYNQIYWDGRDAEGDKLANNTYFFKLVAKEDESGDKSESIGKLIILH